jgi:hypothetical protein
MYSFWPISSHQKCGWDNQHFTTAPILLVISTNGFRLICMEINFCSFNCAKAFMLFNDCHYSPTMVNMLLYLRMRFHKLKLLTKSTLSPLQPARLFQNISLREIKHIRKDEFECVSRKMTIEHARELGVIIRFHTPLALSVAIKDRIQKEKDTTQRKKEKQINSNKNQLDILRNARVLSNEKTIEQYSNPLLASLNITVRRIYNHADTFGK